MGESAGFVFNYELVMSDAEWILLECDESQVAELAAQAGLPRVVARLLVNRGITTAKEAQCFFDPSLEHFHDPFLLPDMDVAVNRLVRAVRSGEKICVHGDYDVDGVTSTALLVRTLKALKANVTYHLPHRQRDGYGLKPQTVVELARQGTRLIVTCDCGVTALDAVAAANEKGVDVIVTDHHEPGLDLPEAIAVVNPKREDAAYPFPELAGVGVAFKLGQGLVRASGVDEELFITRFTDLAALGTVGDVVPLLGENRSIVKHGLDVLPETKKVGLRKMISCAGLAGKPLTAQCLAFILGPRLNAAGRMDDAASALRLLLTKNEDEAAFLIREIEVRNNERRAEQERVFSEALPQAERKAGAGRLVLVISGVGWNRGVIGIVAGKICELFNRPVVVISRDEQRGIGSGSARSIPEFNLVESLESCAELLDRFGGHALAAGLTIELSRLDEFEDRINAVASEKLVAAKLVPRVEIEAEVSPVELTVELAEMVSAMQPFGHSNPEPLFLTTGLKVAEVRRVGDGSHLKLQVCGRGSSVLSCIGFGFGDTAAQLTIGDLVDLCYSIRVDDYGGNEVVQLVLKGIRPSKRTAV
jgi:single-stranded-DNA-specific exonuclease